MDPANPAGMLDPTRNYIYRLFPPAKLAATTSEGTP